MWGMPDLTSKAPEEKKVPDADLVDGFVQLIERGDKDMAVAAVLDLYPADAGQVLTHLSFEQAHTLFHWLPDEPAADVLAELDDVIGRKCRAFVGVVERAIDQAIKAVKADGVAEKGGKIKSAHVTFSF